MAWVEAKGTGFRVRYRREDGTVATENGFDTREAAKDRADAINAGPLDPAPTQPPTAPPAPHQHPAAAHVLTTPTAPPTIPAATAPPTRPPSDPPIPSLINPFKPPAPRPARHPAAASPTLQQWTEAWAKVLRASPATIAKYESLLRIHILPALGQSRIEEITQLDVQNYANTLADALAPNTVDSIISLLSTILGSAAANRLIQANPCYKLRRDYHTTTERAHANPLQIIQTIDRMRPQDATMVITGAYTGMRWGELAGLAWDNVLLDQEIPEIRVHKDTGALHEVNGRLWLGEPKTRASARTIALPPFLAALLTANRATTRSDFVFTAERGGWLRRSNFARRIWEPAVEGNPDQREPSWRTPIVPGMTFHGLRHSHKTWMQEDDILDYVQYRRLGHANTNISDTYTHLTPTLLQPLLTALENRYHQSILDYTNITKDALVLVA